MAAITGAVIAAGTAAYSIANAEKQKKDAKKAMQELEVPDLDNAFEDIPISTVGSDLLNEQNARTNAGLVDAAKSGGSRTVMSSLPKIGALSNSANQQTRKYLDDQDIRRNYAAAGDESRIRTMQEQRYTNEVIGINNMLQTSEQNMWNGIRGLSNTAMYAARNIDWNNDGETTGTNEETPYLP